MAAGIGSMNVFYQRYSETAGIITAPQPGFAVSDYADAGFGWSRYRYYNFNGDYVRYSETAGIPTAAALPYQRYVAVYDAQGQFTGNISTTPGVYRRHDLANVGYITAGNDIPNIEP